MVEPQRQVGIRAMNNTNLNYILKKLNDINENPR
jgi:hypothetical protein